MISAQCIMRVTGAEASKKRPVHGGRLRRWSLFAATPGALHSPTTRASCTLTTVDSLPMISPVYTNKGFSPTRLCCGRPPEPAQYLSPQFAAVFWPMDLNSWGRNGGNYLLRFPLILSSQCRLRPSQPRSPFSTRTSRELGTIDVLSLDAAIRPILNPRLKGKLVHSRLYPRGTLIWSIPCQCNSKHPWAHGSRAPVPHKMCIRPRDGDGR